MIDVNLAARDYLNIAARDYQVGQAIRRPSWFP
jgi:hypothetical protein